MQVCFSEFSSGILYVQIMCVCVCVPFQDPEFVKIRESGLIAFPVSSKVQDLGPDQHYIYNQIKSCQIING